MSGKKSAGGNIIFSTKSKIMILFLITLARRSSELPVNIQAVADEIGLSYNYISRLLRPLREAGIVKPVTGSNGGYLLSRSLAKITVLDIMDLVEAEEPVFSCIRNPDRCWGSAECEPRLFWGKVTGDVRDIFSAITLEQLVAVHSKYPTVAPSWPDPCL